ADKPLDSYSPIFKTGDDQITTGYSMGTLEKIGLLKVDFLGLRTLTVIDETVKLVEKIHGKKIDIKNLPLDDEKTFKLLAASRTMGVFQVESSGMRDLLKKLEPTRFEDLIALLALYRPGPIGSGMLDDFMKRKHNLVPVKYELPQLEAILKETYGIMVYQEQIMQVASSLAGFSLAQADLLRKAMGKKIPEVMEKQRKNFVTGCVKNKIRESTASKIFDLIEYFSGYGFNKCVAGSTEIIDADTGKPVTVKGLFEKSASARFTLSCDENLGIVKTKIKDVVYNGIKPVYKLKTGLGREIIATSNHPFFTFNGWQELGDLRIGQRIVLNRITPFEGTLRLDEHKIIVLAWVLSEGNTCHPSGVYFYNNDRKLVDDFVANAKNFDNTIPTIRQRSGRFEVYAGTGKDCRFFKGQSPWNKGTVKLMDSTKSGVRVWVEELGLHYKKATEKFIPEDIFSLNKQQLALFLGRMWSGDGFIFSKNNTVPFYATSSYRLCQQMQELFLRFGMVTRLTKNTFKYQYKDTQSLKQGFTLYLFGSTSIKAFIQEICPFIIGRDEQISAIKDYYKNVPAELESKDTLPPEIKQLVREEKEKLGLTWVELEEKTGICMKEFYGGEKKHKKGFRRNTILQLAHFFESPRLLRFVNSDIVWDRVEEIEYIGRQETYDLEIEGIHNFVANGIIVHNSHSAAYALISYRTAYLKANYPVEFMTALLTSERDNTDKVVEYINEAERMGLKVLPPDINESEILFSVVDQGTIRYGLLAVKNVGAGGAESIVQARKQGGKFATLEDLAKRIDLRLANKKVLESLIKCGALDSFNMPRAQMIAALEMILESASRQQRERAKGQLSFFDAGSADNGFKQSSNSIPHVKEWPEPQLLAFEKEMLGFYVSGHPLARYSRQLKRFASTSIATLHTHKDEDEIKLVALIAKIKQTTTRAKQEKMAILKVEDLDGSVEALVFPRTYQKVSRYLQLSTVVMLRGIINLKEDTPKIIVNDLFPIDEIYKLISGMSINISGVRENIFDSLRELLSASRGSVPIYLHVDTPAKSRVQLVVGESLYVSPNEKLIQDIESLLGAERLTLAL
ncbi:MAG: DNA polymerase III subunit alpha, partial [Candidatus Omnitrophica bacterium]|nr:DNA polymerase III subunit alpha [Candidatus Omnitrophota bacterium]